MTARAMIGMCLQRFPAALVLALLCVPLLCGQEPQKQRIGGPDDWTHHRLVFSDAGTAETASRNGVLDRWLEITSDPRYILQREKRAAAAMSAGNFAGISSGVGVPATAEERPCGHPTIIPAGPLRRGLARASQSFRPQFAADCRSGFASPGSKASSGLLHQDWSENMGNGATVGLGMFPAKYSFDISSASCAADAQPDFVVYNTSRAGSSSQASVIAYDNLYTGCSTGTVPSTYWAYNTGGTVGTSVVLSGDGSQVAFAQTNTDGSASLVVLRWKASTTESAGSPGAPMSETAAKYQGCTAPCYVALSFSGGASDSGSSVFYDYGSDTIYVGDDSGKLHKFTGVFDGTPGEAGSPWPVTVSSAALSWPVYDAASGNIFIGDYVVDPESNCGTKGTPCGYFYSVSASSGTIVGTSSKLDYGFGIVDAPIVDSTAGSAYVFVGADGSASGVSSCGTDVPCSGVFQFSTSFASGSGTEAQVGPGNEFVLAGALDNEYFSSSDAGSPTGNLYVVGSTGADNTLYQIAISSGVMSTSPSTGPTVSTNFSDGDVYSAGLNITEFYTGSNDYIFLGVLSFGVPANCDASLDNGCVMGYDVTSGTIAAGPTGATAEAGGTSSIIIDNASGFSGASNIYYTPLANQTCGTSGAGGCAIQVSQASP